MINDTVRSYLHKKKTDTELVFTISVFFFASFCCLARRSLTQLELICRNVDAFHFALVTTCWHTAKPHFTRIFFIVPHKKLIMNEICDLLKILTDIHERVFAVNEKLVKYLHPFLLFFSVVL